MVVGDPRLDNVRMGPLASLLTQRREVLGAAQRSCDGRLQLDHGRASSTSRARMHEKGAFVPPTLLYCTRAVARPRRFITVEAFGPVCTVVPYDTTR